MTDYEATVRVAIRPKGEIGDRLVWEGETDVEARTPPRAMEEALRQAPGDLASDLELRPHGPARAAE